jgi:SAM-dependent methyltransferase
MQVRDLFAMRAHWGWAHVLLSRAQELPVPGAGKVTGWALERLAEHTERRTRAFDAAFGTRTSGRLDVKVSSDAGDETKWGYAAINQDFFREIMRSIPKPLAPYAFVDVGSGMGAAVFLASEFGFRKLVGVELTPELVDIARSNCVAFGEVTGSTLSPEWICQDFFHWEIPAEPQLFFFNNPFPADLTLKAVQALERSHAEHPRPMLLVARKAPNATGDYLHASSLWKPLRLAPYWRVYTT